jgi:flagellar hook assembly protein FlgD
MTLDQNNPNPFQGSTTINFTLPTRNFTTLEVVDLYGNVVKTLVAAELAGQSYSYIWDGTNQNDQYVSNGTYIYRLTSGSQVLTGKMTLLK